MIGQILVVDDDPRCRALVAEEAPALVVLDVNLPSVSGYEVCRRLRDRNGTGLPIVFLSGERVESFDRVAGLLIGADDYVVKPFAPDELVARVQRLLGRLHAPAQPRGLSHLTKRELEVLGLLAEGKSQPELADSLVISQKTVGTHIEHISRSSVSRAARKRRARVPGSPPRSLSHRLSSWRSR
jgi:DNA-binding NarL/FixJ family response regulator